MKQDKRDRKERRENMRFLQYSGPEDEKNSGL